MLVLLYYLSQNPDFSDSVKPLMAKLKDSEQMLCFLKDLSSFTQTFSTFQNPQKKKEEEKNTERYGDVRSCTEDPTRDWYQMLCHCHGFSIAPRWIFLPPTAAAGSVHLRTSPYISVTKIHLTSMKRKDSTDRGYNHANRKISPKMVLRFINIITDGKF